VIGGCVAPLFAALMCVRECPIRLKFQNSCCRETKRPRDVVQDSCMRFILRSNLVSESKVEVVRPWHE
jgi:hypothetical protein